MENKNQELNPDTNNNAGSTPSLEEFAIFKKKIASLINLDLTNYKNTQMERRIVSLMHRNNIANLANYYDLLKKFPKHLGEFVNMLTINATEFFRNFVTFIELGETYIPELLQKSPRLKIWSSGCSIGAEIYSIAMILDKLGILDKCELIASDFDENVINKAKSGIYSGFEIGNLPVEYLNYFQKLDTKMELFQIDSNLISKVKFHRQDLLDSRFESNFDLILCRNVVIYFTEEAKDCLYKKFYTSLKSGGILFIGSSDWIGNHKELGFKLRSAFFYQK